jgi:hypothetical protein
MAELHHQAWEWANERRRADREQEAETVAA